MSIDTAVLGYLSWRALTGYDLKKLFADNPLFHWSGNSNQIYRALLRLHGQGWLSLETIVHKSSPPRKVYSITEAGRAALRNALSAQPEATTARSPFLAQLAWADILTAEELETLLDCYYQEVETNLAALRERVRRGLERPDRSQREAAIWMLMEQRVEDELQLELDWVARVRDELRGLGDE